MSLFYRFAYRLGFTPWERAALQEWETVAALFEREEEGRDPPYGPALDLGCGTGLLSVELAKRGWQVTGVDIVPKALRKARERVRQAAVEAHFVHGDVTALRDSGVGSGFQFLLDVGCFHGLNEGQRERMGREVSAVAAPGATLLMLVWAPGRRGPLPRGASRTDLETTFPQWKVIDEDAMNPSALPGPLKNVDPRCYRLRRT